MKNLLLIILSVTFLYSLSKLSFFEGVQSGTKRDSQGLSSQGFFGSERRKSTKKEVFATIIYGVITIIVTIGFTIIIFNN